MQKLLRFYLAVFLFSPAIAQAQNSPVIERLYAAVMGPSPITISTTKLALGSRTLDPSHPNIVKTLREYIDRKLTFPGGLYATPLDSIRWQNASWPNLTLRTFTLSMATGQP